MRAAVSAAGGKIIAIKGDVRKTADIQAVVQRTAEEFGPIDILVNNAGSLVERQRLAQISEERWHEVMNLNLTTRGLLLADRGAFHGGAQDRRNSQHRIDRGT